MSTRSLKKALKRAKGFTLIELLIVITIIGILAVALLPRISQGPAKARDAKRRTDINNLATAMELYYSDTGAYPYDGTTAPTSAAAKCLNPANTGTTIEGKLLNGYMQAIPTDPSDTVISSCGSGYYLYYRMPYASSSTNFASSFALIADLELAGSSTSADGDYCFASDPSSSTTWGTYSNASSGLQSATCGSTTDAFYVILR